MMGPQCQSCGMPLKQDPAGGGTNADGTINPDYCSHCYQNGAFTEPDISLEAMKARVMEKIQEKGFPKIMATMMSGGIKNLKRWSS